jgi:tetratricopeptide (TPR) repeat protein
MTERRVLVIGSQCKALGELSFLPAAAHDVYAVMTDPERGSCVSALDGEGLLINPTVQAAKEAIRTAYASAAKDEATLFIAYIGHGLHFDNDFYLLPLNASPTPTSDTAIHLTQLIKEQHRISPGRGVDGLGVLVDACYSGTAAISVAQQWVDELKADMRFEVMTATSAIRPAADGCFSRNLIRILSDGLADVPDSYLRCIHLRARLERACPEQDAPQHPAYNPDETLWLAKNGRRSPLPWAETSLSSEIERLTMTYQATPNLADVVRQSQVHSCLAVVGEAGMGKSALAAALAWPEKAPQMLTTGFVQAIVLLNEAQTPQEIARLLSQQLCRSVAGFQTAQREFDRNTPYAEKQRLGSIEKQVIEPLRLLTPQAEVRIVVDALDRLATGAEDAVMGALDALAGLPFLRLIVTARPATSLPDAAEAYLLEAAPDEQVRRYLQERAIPADRTQELLAMAKGNWLVVRVLADLVCDDREAGLSSGQLALADAFAELLTRCGANCSPNCQIVLTLLAAGGAGPVLPLVLLCAASEQLGGPGTTARVRDELVRLRGLVIRSDAGTKAEHVGLFHQTLVEHILTQEPEKAIKAHRALADAIADLAPPGPSFMDLDDHLQRYAFERQADHLWAVGDTEEAFNALEARRTSSPRDNLLRWMSWQDVTFNQLGSDHPGLHTSRKAIAYWIGECGDVHKAHRLFSELLHDEEQVLGAYDPEILVTRLNIAHSFGKCGDAQKALSLLTALLHDQIGVLDADSQITLITRSNIAFWTGVCGDAPESLRLSLKLLPDVERVLGADHQLTLTIRNTIASMSGECGDAQVALRLSQELLSDRERVFGADHPLTLTSRNNIARWTGGCGDARNSLRLFLELLPDLERVLGADHPDTLSTRINIASMYVECGNALEALRFSQELLSDRERVLGADHPATLDTRGFIALWTWESGDARKSLRLYLDLLPDLERVLGADHPKTIAIRIMIKIMRCS